MEEKLMVFKLILRSVLSIITLIAAIAGVIWVTKTMGAWFIGLGLHKILSYIFGFLAADFIVGSIASLVLGIINILLRNN